LPCRGKANSMARTTGGEPSGGCVAAGWGAGGRDAGAWARGPADAPGLGADWAEAGDASPAAATPHSKSLLKVLIDMLPRA
jgi:hypothetical protein